MWGRRVPSKGNTSQRPCAAPSSACSRTSRKAIAAGAECMGERGGDKVGKII